MCVAPPLAPIRQGLTENQRRLLYLMSLYSSPATTSAEKERWIRKPSVLVLIYEGIVAQVLDYDYAPSSEVVESRRMYFNISQVRGHVSPAGCGSRCLCVPSSLCVTMCACVDACVLFLG